MRGLTLQWAAGLFGALVGGFMLVEPHQFRATIYEAIEPQLACWGGVLLASGSALVALRLVSFSRPVVVGLHLGAGSVLLLFGTAMAATRVWTDTVVCASLGIGTALAPFLSTPPTRARPIDLFVVIAALATAISGLLMLTLPEGFTSPLYAGLVPHMQLYGAAGLVAGLALLGSELDWHGAPRGRLLARVTATVFCLAMVVLVALPASSWTGLLYWGGFAAILLTSLERRAWRPNVDRVPLRVQLALLVATVTALALILTLAVESNRDDSVIVSELLADQATLASGTAANVADWLAWQQSSVASLAAQPAFDRLSPADQALALAGLHPTYPAIHSFLRYDGTGQIVARSRPGSEPDALAQSVFEQAREARRLPVAAGAAEREPQRGNFVVGARITRANGEFGGAIVGVGDLAALADLLRRTASDDDHRVYLLDHDGQVIAPPGASLGRDIAARTIEAQQGSLRAADPGDPAGERLVGFAPVGGLDWQVAIDVPAARGTGAIASVHDLVFRTMLTAIVLAGLAGALIGGRLVAPLRRLARTAEQLAGGERDVEWPRARSAEVADLSASLVHLRERLLAQRADQLRPIEASARESNQTLSALVRASPLAVVVTDASARVTAWNPAAERLFGWRIDEALGRPVGDFFEHPIQEPEGSLDRQARRPIETRRRTRDNELVEVAVWAAPLGRTADNPNGLLLILADIAERKRLDEERTRLIREQTARDEALELQRRLAFLAEASAELNASLDLEATIETAVRVAVPELADWCALDLVDTDDMRCVAAPSVDAGSSEGLRLVWQRRQAARSGESPIADSLLTREPVLLAELTAEHLRGANQQPLESTELELIRSLEPLSAIAVPLLGRDEPLGVLTFISVRGHRTYDATDLALAEALVRRCAVAIENARLYREAQDALRARDTFLSIASHELGSPLARVKAYAEVLLMAQSNQQLDERLLNRSLRSIDRATTRLTTITQDLFDVSRLRIGDLQLRRLRLNFAKLVREVTRSYVDELDDRHQLKVRIARGSYPVDIDPDRMEQVLDNLLRNAVKYSPEGGTVFVSMRHEEDGVLLMVRDEGIGLPPGATDVIFEPFGRAANAERRNLPGMGLGLYICRSIVERHGGRIWADSPGEHKGMRISVWLPLAN